MTTWREVHNNIVIFALLVTFICGLGVAHASEAVRVAGHRLPVSVETERFTNEWQNKIRNAVHVYRRNIGRLHNIRGLIASGTGLDANGNPVIRVLVERAGLPDIPSLLEGVPVGIQVSGRFYALRGITCDSSADNRCENDERWPLPVPIGISVGHPSVTAGSIGARLTDDANVFVLSNNHVLAASNQANIGDPIVQPGIIDGGQVGNDTIATLSDFEPIIFCDPIFFQQILFGHDCSDSSNIIDGAIALTTQSELGFSTPVGEYESIAGYGAPRNSFNSAYDDGDLSDLLGVTVKKYGKRTALTTGSVSMIDATVEVCYDQDCINKAIFLEQLVITPGNFSSPGDSGSLVVDNENRAVGLLFAGNTTNTIANRIDNVMQRFDGLSIDDGGDSEVPIEFGILCSRDSTIDGSDSGCDGTTQPDGLWIYLWPEQNVSTVDFYVDGAFRGTEQFPPYELDAGSRTDLGAGNHTVRAVINLENGGSQETSATFNVGTPP